MRLIPYYDRLLGEIREFDGSVSSFDEVSKSYDVAITYATFLTPDDLMGQHSKRMVYQLEFTASNGLTYKQTFTYDTYGNPNVNPKWVTVAIPRFGMWAMWPWLYPITPDAPPDITAGVRYASAMGLLPNIH